MLARILADPDSPLDSAIYQDSPGFYLPVSFWVLARNLPDLGNAWILPFLGIHADSTLFQFSPGHFFGTRMDST